MSWVVFIVFILSILACDFFFYSVQNRELTLKNALIKSSFWILFALIFNLGIYLFQGEEAALQFLTGYLIEKSLSIDNLFVFLLIFSHFSIPGCYTHKILFWGVLGAILTRGVFIFCGLYLIKTFHFMNIVFGVILLIVGIRLGINPQTKATYKESFFLKLLCRWLPIAPTFGEGSFVVVRNGKYAFTMLFVALLAIEITDIMFALDSVPAIFAITQDPFIVYTSNIFAVLGLRSLFSLLSSLLKSLRQFHYGLSLMMVFIGFKMVLSDWIVIPIPISLAVVAAILLITVLISSIIHKRLN